MFSGNEELALAGYNGGPYRIKRLWREEGAAAELDLFLEGLALTETTRYVKRIVLFRDTYDRLDGGRGVSRRTARPRGLLYFPARLRALGP